MINYAMNFGAVVGVYYIGKFCLFPLSLHFTMAALLFLGLTLVVPFLIYQLVKRYRDSFWGGRLILFVLLHSQCLLWLLAHY